MAVFREFPDISMPRVENVICPSIVTTVISRIGAIYSNSISGTIIIPTDMKNTAPNISLIGLIMCSTFSASTVPPMIEPAIKAPSADEKPITFASITIPRHIASDTISRDSSFISLEAFLRNVGIRYIPSASQSTRYKMSSPSSPAIAMPPALSLLTAIVERIIIIKIPPISSITSVPSTSVANFFLLMPNSS